MLWPKVLVRRNRHLGRALTSLGVPQLCNCTKDMLLVANCMDPNLSNVIRRQLQEYITGDTVLLEGPNQVAETNTHQPLRNTVNRPRADTLNS